MDNKRKVEVSVMGQHFQIRSEKPEEYLKGLAAFVTERLETIQQNSRIASTHDIALLLSLNLADQLFEKDDSIDQLKKQLESRTEAALREVESVLSGIPESAPTQVSDDDIL
ncbi:MAG: cell division protein ZapA [Deltaproteobacteria bacterium]|nr:cell division protein ZapA [Deltaproteobacteria bacterium]